MPRIDQPHIKKMATGSRTSASFLTLCVHPRIALKCSSCHSHCGGMSVESGDNRTVTITANTGQLQSPSFLFQALIVGTCRCQAGRRLDDPARLVCESAWPEGGKSPATLCANGGLHTKKKQRLQGLLHGQGARREGGL